MDATKWSCKSRGIGVAGQWVTAGDLRDLAQNTSKWLQTPMLREAHDSAVCLQGKARRIF